MRFASWNRWIALKHSWVSIQVFPRWQNLCLIFDFIFIIMVFCLWHYVKTWQLIMGETSTSILAILGRLAANPTVAWVEQVANGALSIDIVLTNEVYNSLSFEVHLTYMLACVQLSTDYWLALLIWRWQASYVVDVVCIWFIEFWSSLQWSDGIVGAQALIHPGATDSWLWNRTFANGLEIHSSDSWLVGSLWPLLLTWAKLFELLVFSNNVELIAALIGSQISTRSCCVKQIWTTLVAGDAYLLSPSSLHIHGSRLVGSAKLLLLKVFMSVGNSTLHPLFGWDSLRAYHIRCSRWASSNLPFIWFHELWRRACLLSTTCRPKCWYGVHRKLLGQNLLIDLSTSMPSILCLSFYSSRSPQYRTRLAF